MFMFFIDLSTSCYHNSVQVQLNHDIQSQLHSGEFDDSELYCFQNVMSDEGDDEKEVKVSTL